MVRATGLYTLAGRPRPPYTLTPYLRQTAYRELDREQVRGVGGGIQDNGEGVGEDTMLNGGGDDSGVVGVEGARGVAGGAVGGVRSVEDGRRACEPMARSARVRVAENGRRRPKTR